MAQKPRAEKAPLVPVAPARKPRGKSATSADGEVESDGAKTKAKPARPRARSGQAKAGKATSKTKANGSKSKRPKPDLGVTRVIERGGRRRT